MQGTACPCIFTHMERGLFCSVHGDDFTTIGPKHQLDAFELELASKYELRKSPRLGPGPEDAKEGVILNRIVRWTEAGLEYEADPRQSEKLIEELGMGGVNAAPTPGMKPLPAQLAADKPLPEKEHTGFRASAARANYLSADRPECQFAGKEVCRWMAGPTDLSQIALKRLSRFVAGRPRLVYLYPWQEADRLDCYSDTDWAGCVRTRKSTSGGCLMLGRHVLKTWSATQSTISLSSGEAEYYGVVRAGGVALGQQSLMADMGIKLAIRVWTDSTAAIGICGRQGLGKLRHIDTHTLWMQQKVRDGTIELRKVHGESNPADLFTKHMPSKSNIEQLLKLFGCEYREGRAVAAPQLRKKRVDVEEGSDDDEDEVVQYFDLEFVDTAERHDETRLPHWHTPAEMQKLFPRAVAAPDLEEHHRPQMKLNLIHFRPPAEDADDPGERPGGGAPE